MSVNMFRDRFLIEAQPRSKKGHPPHSTTGVASSSWIQVKAVPPIRMRTGLPGSISDMVMRNTGSERAALTQKRRVMSTNS